MAGFLDAFLEDNPNILYQALRPGESAPGFGNSFIDYWRGRQGDVWNDYLGDIGRTVLGGEEPTQTFRSYLGDYDWMGYWRGLNPGQRGSQGSQTPRLRWFI